MLYIHLLIHVAVFVWALGFIVVGLALIKDTFTWLYKEHYAPSLYLLCSAVLLTFIAAVIWPVSLIIAAYLRAKYARRQSK